MNYGNKRNINNKTHILQFIPKQLAHLTEISKVEWKDKQLKTAYILDLVHKMLTKHYFSKKLEMNLSSVILREWYGTFYNFYVEYLIHINVITKVSSYQAKKKCTTYKISKSIASDKVMRWENSSKFLLDKWKNHFGSRTQVVHNSHKCINPWVKQALVDDLFYVRIDEFKANNLLADCVKSGKMDDICYWRNKMSIESIADGSLYYTEDSYGRMHTNFTILKKIIRNNCITIGDEEVSELDIKNSQPSFLAMLLKEEGFDAQFPEEYDSFRSVVKSGIFYDVVKDAANISREEAKDLTYKVLFGRTIKSKHHHKIFNSLYPNIWNWIKDLKTKHKDHCILAHKLQRRESSLIFDNICFQIKKEHADIKMFTVHDSIFFPKKLEKEVSTIFNTHLESIFS